MATSKDYRNVGLNDDKNQNIPGSSPSSEFDRLEDCNEAEFRGATLSLSQETSPAESVAPFADPNGNREDVSGERAPTLRTLSNVQEFFAVRDGTLQHATELCRPVILEHIDGELRGVWLLTEIDHWDTEKERILFLTQNSLISLKFDFICLRLLDYQRYDLKSFKQVIIGELKYPEKSLMPARNQLGIQCWWGNAEPIPALKRWNPWSRDIPWVTYTSHPLFKMDTMEKDNYNVENFSKKILAFIKGQEEAAQATTEAKSPAVSPMPSDVDVKYQPIVIESYVGVVAALHNSNELGFFKSRGKVSF